MWTRIRCSQCRSSFTSVSAFLAHTHTAGDDAAERRRGQRGHAGARTAATINTADSTLGIKRTASRKNLHRVRVHSRRRTADQLRRSDELT